MSAALVRKSLEIVDPSYKRQFNHGKKGKGVFGLIPENQKIIFRSNKKGGKVEKSNLLSTQKKLTVIEVRKKTKTKEQIIKKNLEKLELIRKACSIELSKEATSQIIERAVTKRPIKRKSKNKKQQKTAFTEEDFRKFEEEYVDA